MRVCQSYDAVFVDPNLVSCAGLAPVLQLAERAGLEQLTAPHLHLGKTGGANAHLKIPALVAGMVAGADSIDDMATSTTCGSRLPTTAVSKTSDPSTPGCGWTAVYARWPAPKHSAANAFTS